MKAQVIKQFGESSVFELDDIPTPKVEPGHVLIRVEASSVNPVDTKIRSGVYQAVAPAFPAVLHSDVAGVVIDVGQNVKQFKVGDEVYGCAGGFKGNGGALAEYMLTDASLIAHKPKKLSMVEAAALPLVGITAWEALFDRAHLKEKQSLLIQGATGGVGHIAIQLAKWKKAEVYATASSPEKLKKARELGAIGINYKEQSVTDYVNQYTQGKGFEVVLDTVGGACLADSFVACTTSGTVSAISSGGTFDLTPLHKKGLTLHAIFMPTPLLTGIGRKRHGEILAELSQLVDSGYVAPLIDSVFPFSKVGEAHTRLESGQAMGKVVVKQDLLEEMS